MSWFTILNNIHSSYKMLPNVLIKSIYQGFKNEKICFYLRSNYKKSWLKIIMKTKGYLN